MIAAAIGNVVQEQNIPFEYTPGNHVLAANTFLDTDQAAEGDTAVVAAAAATDMAAKEGTMGVMYYCSHLAKDGPNRSVI